MTVTAILSALAEEQQGLLEQLHKPQRVRHGGRDFWEGELNSHRVVLGLSRIGKVAAATTATTAHTTKLAKQPAHQHATAKPIQTPTDTPHTNLKPTTAVSN